MKITSSTSTTSTSGVMLISASAVCVWPFLFVKATCGLPFDGVLIGHQRDFFHAVQQFARKIVHARSLAAQPPCELVIGNHRWNSDNQARGGGDQRLRYAGRHRAKGCRPGRAKSVKGIDNAHDRSKEAHKR